MTGSNIEKILSEDGVFVSTTSGVSMYPLLRHRRDTIIITPTTGRLKKYDVPLYRRGNEYVLHRIIKVLPDSYIIRGDNCILLEHVKDDEIIGELTGIYRKEKEVNMHGWCYKLYSRIIVLINPFVCFKLKLRAKINQIKAKIKK